MNRLIIASLLCFILSVNSYCQNIFAGEGENMFHANVSNSLPTSELRSVGLVLGYTLNGRLTGEVGGSIMGHNRSNKFIDGFSTGLGLSYLLLKQDVDNTPVSVGPHVCYNYTKAFGGSQNLMSFGADVTREFHLFDKTYFLPTVSTYYNMTSTGAASENLNDLGNFVSYHFTFRVINKGYIVAPTYSIYGPGNTAFSISFGSFFYN